MFPAQTTAPATDQTTTAETTTAAPETTEETTTRATAAAETKETEEETTVELPNPVHMVESPEDFEQLGLGLDAPAGAENQQYFILQNTADPESTAVAQVLFTLDGIDYTLRGSHSTEDISGIFTTFEGEPTIETATATNGSTTEVSIAVDANGTMVATWHWASAIFTLSATAPDQLESFTQTAVTIGGYTYLSEQ